MSHIYGQGSDVQARQGTRKQHIHALEACKKC